MRNPAMATGRQGTHSDSGLNRLETDRANIAEPTPKQLIRVKLIRREAKQEPVFPSRQLYRQPGFAADVSSREIYALRISPPERQRADKIAEVQPFAEPLPEEKVKTHHNNEHARKASAVILQRCLPRIVPTGAFV